MCHYIDAQDDPEFIVFGMIADCSWHLPIGSDREFYSWKGTDEELKAAITALEQAHGPAARVAALKLKEKYLKLIEPAAGGNAE